MDTFYGIWNAIVQFWNTVITVLSALFNLPLGIGWLLETAFIFGIVIFLYRFTTLRNVLGGLFRKIGPYVMPQVRWQWQSEKGKERIVYRDRPGKKRSVVSSFSLRARWLVLGVVLVKVFEHWDILGPYVWAGFDYIREWLHL